MGYKFLKKNDKFFINQGTILREKVSYLPGKLILNKGHASGSIEQLQFTSGSLDHTIDWGDGEITVITPFNNEVATHSFVNNSSKITITPNNKFAEYPTLEFNGLDYDSIQHHPKFINDRVSPVRFKCLDGQLPVVASSGSVYVYSDSGINLFNTEGNVIEENFVVTCNGPVSQGGSVVVKGKTTISAGAANNITLNNVNDFNTVSVVSGATVTIYTIGAFDFGATNVTTNYFLTANGAVTDSGDILVGNGLRVVTGIGDNITLDQAGNDVTLVLVVSANDVLINVVDDLRFVNTTISGTLNATTGGAISDQGYLTVTGEATLDANGGASDITLTETNLSTLSFTGNNVSVADTNGLVIKDSVANGNLTVTVSSGNITESGSVSVGGIKTYNQP